MSRRRHRPGYVTIHRDAMDELAREGVDDASAWTLARLVGLANHDTHRVDGSQRWVARRLGTSRNTLAGRLQVLRKWVTVEPGLNQNAEGAIVITRWDELTGEIPVAQPLAQSVAQNLSQQATSDQRKRSPSSSSSSRSRSRPSSEKGKTTSPWRSWTPSEDWPAANLRHLRRHCEDIDEGRLFRLAGAISASAFEQLALGRPPTRPVVEIVVERVLVAEGDAQTEAYEREKAARRAEVMKQREEFSEMVDAIGTED